MHKLDADDPRPRYEQVTDALRHRIRSGEIPPGGKLPSHDQMRADFDVSLGTVKRAYAVLEEEGLIVSRQGQGAYVRTRPGSAVEPAAGDEIAELRGAVAALAERLDAVERRLPAQ